MMFPFKKILTSAVALLCLFVAPHIASAGYTWAETQPGGAANLNWQTGASSGDGQTLVAGIFGGRLYLSTNGGTSWAETQPAGAVNQNWFASAISDDGQTLLASPFGGRLYLSTTTGSTWVETRPAGDVARQWRGIAIDADGSTLVAAETTTAGSGRAYISTNSGSSWTEIQPAGNVNKGWSDAAISADGSHIALPSNGASLYLTTNGGTSWDIVSPPGSRTWINVSISNDGQSLVTQDSDCLDDSVFISTSTGSSWTASHVSGNVSECWYAGLDADSDLSHILSGEDGGTLFATANTGDTWTDTPPAGQTNKSWYIVDLDGDGSNALAAVQGGRIYLGTYVDTDQPQAASFTPADGATNVGLGDDLSITFDENIAASTTGNVVIKKTSDDSVVATVSVVDSAVSISGTTATVNPAADLENSTGYYVQIDAGAIVDLSDNAYAGISSATTWNFTTVAAPAGEEEGGNDGGSTGSHQKPLLGEGVPERTLTNDIQSLEARLAELRAVLAGLLGGPSYMRDLMFGSNGNDVVRLQLFLISENKGPNATALANAGATGFFGPLTRSALAEYQASVGITPAAGYLGPITRAYLSRQ